MELENNKKVKFITELWYLQQVYVRQTGRYLETRSFVNRSLESDYVKNLVIKTDV